MHLDQESKLLFCRLFKGHKLLDLFIHQLMYIDTMPLIVLSVWTVSTYSPMKYKIRLHLVLVLYFVCHIYLFISGNFTSFMFKYFFTRCVGNFLFHLSSILNILLISVAPENLAYCLFRSFFFPLPTGHFMQSRGALSFWFYLIKSSAVCQIHMVQII